MEITTEENRISIDGVSYPKGGFYVKPIPKGVALVAMSKSWSIKILVDDTTIDGSPVADRDELMTFFNEQGFKAGGSDPGTEASWGSITGDIEDQIDLVNYIAENGGSVELGQGLHFDENGKVALGMDIADRSGQSDTVYIGNIKEDSSGLTLISLRETGIQTGIQLDVHRNSGTENSRVSSVAVAEAALLLSEYSNTGGAVLQFKNGDILFGKIISSFEAVDLGLDITDDFGFRIVDDINNIGVIYADDYSANGKLDDRWIPDWGAVKAYVDDNQGTAPTWTTIEGKPDFVAEGADAAAARTALGLGTAATTDSSASAVNDSLVVRTSTGQGKFAPAVNADEAVVLSQHQADLDLKVDKVAGKGLSDTNFTADEKLKLAGLEDVHYKGWHPSLSALQAKYPTADEGSHAFVDDVSGSVAYIWDVSENSWVIRAGESTELTPAQTKVLYESNPDTNAFTDDFKSKLESITSIFTTALKTAYDNAVSWISVNGVNLLNHLSNKSNPHEVTASQIGLGNVDNTRDADKPMSTATKNYVDSVVGKAWIPDYANMEDTNRITSTGGSWTSDRTGFVYVLSRGYNSGIYHTQVAFINDKEVGKVWVEAPSGSGDARSGSFANIYPVKAGDVIKLYGNLEVKCFFIPGIWV